ncbi:hypothetical protein [Actinorhabdospora filicis]|nr:hypothetical protein [Actinorhabdospora filicis]
MSTRTLLIVLIATGSGVGMALAGQLYLAVPTAIAVLGGLHAIIGR